MSITSPAPTLSSSTDFQPSVSGRTAIGDAADVAWHPVCEVEDLEPAWGEAVLVRDRQIAVVLLAPDEIYAVDHRDPRTDAYVMARGIVGSRGDRVTIASPLLKQVYDLQTGACLDDPALALATYRTRVVGGMIEVEVAA